MFIVVLHKFCSDQLTDVSIYCVMAGYFTNTVEYHWRQQTITNIIRACYWTTLHWLASLATWHLHEDCCGCERSSGKNTCRRNWYILKLFLVSCHFCLMPIMSVIYTRYNAVAVIGQLLCVDVEFSGKVFWIGTVCHNWPMSVHASQAFSIAHCTDLEDLPLSVFNEKNVTVVSVV